MPKSKRLAFGIKNVKYATKTGGVYGTPVDLAYADSISFERDYNEIKLYGDGELIAVLPDDKGLDFSLIVTDINDDYEIACGRKLAVQGGTADVNQQTSVEHAIYFERALLVDGVKKTVKVWILAVTSSGAPETFKQVEDDPTINKYEYKMHSAGSPLKNSAGSADYTDANGVGRFVTRITSLPEDTGYATFEATVPVPKIPA